MQVGVPQKATPRCKWFIWKVTQEVLEAEKRSETKKGRKISQFGSSKKDKIRHTEIYWGSHLHEVKMQVELQVSLLWRRKKEGRFNGKNPGLQCSSKKVLVKSIQDPEPQSAVRRAWYLPAWACLSIPAVLRHGQHTAHEK